MRDLETSRSKLQTIEAELEKVREEAREVPLLQQKLH